MGVQRLRQAGSRVAFLVPKGATNTLTLSLEGGNILGLEGGAVEGESMGAWRGGSARG